MKNQSKIDYYKLAVVLLCIASALTVVLFIGCLINLASTEKSLAHDYVKFEQIRNPKRLEI